MTAYLIFNNLEEVKCVGPKGGETLGREPERLETNWLQTWVVIVSNEHLVDLYLPAERSEDNTL